MGINLRQAKNEELVMSLHMTSKVLFRLRKKELAPYGITPEGNIVMTAIQQLGRKATSAEIARFTFREPNSVSALLKRMGKKGLVRRFILNRHSVRQIMVLTKKGQKVFDEINEIKYQSLFNITSFMSDQEEEKFTAQLRQILRGLFQVLGMTRIPNSVIWTELPE